MHICLQLCTSPANEAGLDALLKASLDICYPKREVIVNMVFTDYRSKKTCECSHRQSRFKKSLKVTNLQIVAVLSLIAAILLSGCSNSGEPGTSSNPGGSEGSDKVIKIGMVGPLTGDYATYGQSVKNGVEIAVDEINKSGGVNGFDIQLVAEDSKGDSAEAANAVQKLIDQDKVTAIVGAVLSGETATVAPIAQDAGVVMITPSSTAPGLADIGEYIFRNVITDDVQARQMAEYAVKELGLENLAVIYANNDYGVALKDNFTAKAKELGATVVAVESYLDGDQDFRAQLTKIGGKADGLYIGGYYAEAAKISQQAKRQGMQVQILGGDGFYSTKLVELGGDAVEGALFTAGFYSGDTSENVQSFVSSFTERFDYEPDMFAANAYDSMKIVAQALAESGNDRAALRKEMAAIKDYPGITGNTSFAENGEARKDVIILKVQKGEFQRAK